MTDVIKASVSKLKITHIFFLMILHCFKGNLKFSHLKNSCNMWQCSFCSTDFLYKLIDSTKKPTVTQCLNAIIIHLLIIIYLPYFGSREISCYLQCMRTLQCTWNKFMRIVIYIQFEIFKNTKANIGEMFGRIIIQCLIILNPPNFGSREITNYL